MKALRIAMIGFLAMSSVAAMAQQQMSLHFMQPTLQSAAVNPAVRPINHRWGINLMDYNTQQVFPVSYSQYLRNEGGSRIIDLDALIDDLDPEHNVTSVAASLSTLGFGFQAKKLWIGFRAEAHVDAQVSIPRDLVGLAWRGNAPYIGQTIQIAPKASAALYNSLNLQVAYEVTPTWSVGLTGKYLTGFIGAQSTREDIQMYTDTNIYEISLQTDYAFQMGGFNPPSLDVSWDSTTNSPNINFQDADIDFGRGFGVDFGMQYRHNDKLTVNASLMNVGSITWRNASEYASKGSYTYDGVTVADFIGSDTLAFEGNIDSLFDLLNIQSTPTSMSYRLPSSFYLSGMYKVHPKVSVGALFQMERFNTDYSRMGGAVHAQWNPNRWFQTGVTAGMRSGTPFTLGWHMMVKPGPVQLFFANDNIIGYFSPANNNPSGARMGINLLFGRKWLTMKADEPVEEKI